MRQMLLNVELSVELKNNVVIAHLLFPNNEPNNLYLDKYSICFDSQFRNKVFTISSDKGKEVNYTGMMVKRKMKPEDYIMIKPGENIQTIVTLNDAYSLVKGKKYLIQYSAFNPGSYINSEPVLMKMESSKIEILYT
jgi:hypothetical protein